MGALAGLILLAVVGVGLVVGLAQLLQRSPGLARLPTGMRWMLSHTLIVCGWLVISPCCLAAQWGSPHGDIYGPYMLVPGVHVYYPAKMWLGQVAFPWLLERMESFPASIICIVIGPGLVGLVVGGAQWFLIGTVWERLVSRGQR